MIAAMGYLAALLMIGKAIHNLGKIAKVCVCVYTVCVSREGYKNVPVYL
jgi:hypothetical protein